MTSTISHANRFARLLTGLGIALPVLLMLCFIAFASWQRSNVPSPQHALLVSVPNWNEVSGMSGVRYVVEGDRVIAYPSLELNLSHQLFRVDPQTLQVHRVGVDRTAPPVELPAAVHALSDVRVSTSPIAPDGYAMTDAYDHGPGIIGELFGRRRNGGIGLERDGITHWIEGSEHDLALWNVVFVGWVLND